MISPAEAAGQLQGDAILLDDVLVLDLGELRLGVRSNVKEVLIGLERYFTHVVGAPGPVDQEVMVIERAPVDLGMEFTDWSREPGKTGRKDAFVDIDGGRLIQKIRTGMVFLQSTTHRMAAGPCLAHDNQVINFINSQFMNHLQNAGALICHASGLVKGGKCVGIAGLSGGGKSTLMLKLLNDPKTSYLTNDRLFIRPTLDGLEAIGIPKLPRINPGTILGNPTLHELISDTRLVELNAMTRDVLWDLEEKHDVDVEAVYGAGKITVRAPLHAFLILNWDRASTAPFALDRVDLNERPDLLPAVMKSPGPFYQYPDGRFLEDATPLTDGPYRQTLKNIPVWESTGRLDFDACAEAATAIFD